MTDTRSTDFAITGYREPRGKNVVRSVFVAVVHNPTGWTRPDANVEGKTFDDVPTTVACLAAREEAINLQQGPPVPLALVRQEREKHAPRGVGNNTSEAVVLEHPQYVQILDDDHLVFANQSSAELVEMIAPLVSDTSVKSSELLSSFEPVLGSFLLVSETARENALASQLSFVVFEVDDLLAGRECGERSNSNVDPYGSLELRKQLDSLIFAEKRDVPAIRRIQRNGHGRRLRAIRQWTAPANVQRASHFGQRQRAVLEAERASAKLGGPSVALLLEARVLCSLREKVGVRALEMPERLLKRNARHFVEEGEVGQLLPRSESRALRDVADRLLRGCPGFRSSVQRLVVDETDAPDGAAEQSLLLRRRIEAVAKAPKHGHTLTRASVSATQTGFLPVLKDGVSAPENR